MSNLSPSLYSNSSKSSNKRLWNGIAATSFLFFLFGNMFLFTACNSKPKAEEDNKSTPKIVYKKCPDENHPHKIDLGLPSGTLWACCNVDASKPEDYGGFYAWGETSVKSTYSTDNYKYKYYGSDVYIDIGDNICGTKYDVAHVKWGDSWQMPTKDQIKELLDNCEFEWTTVNGLGGCIFNSKSNGENIFIPAAGYHLSFNSSGPNNVGEAGYYWSGTRIDKISNVAYCLLFYSGVTDVHADFHGFVGCSVRPVAK